MVYFTEEEKRMIIYSFLFMTENTAGLPTADYDLIANITKKLNEDNK